MTVLFDAFLKTNKYQKPRPKKRGFFLAKNLLTLIQK